MPRDLPDRTSVELRALGDRIRHLRMQADCTQEAFAEMTNINRRTLQRIERGVSDPRYTDLVRIAEAVGVPLTDLVRE
ncbi:helix-turn-helix transcriptional regulator [Streptomyces sp. BE147]|uniref:helix-turn-helix domain-containing protein n=1 Tax=Streptomyces sp. BE147 TaxID=3002524 RepID=UPI002E78A1CE|nr:helix-turn-helix transcriptional regulator [Streptomyces sp. BE147]MEE1738843.1 helix-turn-helix transcriptional regulator [Streptomyces sp. BE147]